MKILLLTQVLPYPPDSGPKVKTWNTIKYLSLNHDVTLISFIRGDQSREIQVLKQFCKEVFPVPINRHRLIDLGAMVRSLIRHEAWIILRDDRKEMREMVDRVAAQQSFDIIHADQIYMAQYALRVKEGRKILDTHNALWLLYRRLAETMKPGPMKLIWKRDWKLIKAYEGWACKKFDAVITVSDVDRIALQEATDGEGRFEVIPISVDVEETRSIRVCNEADHMIYIGTMFWPPNADGVLWFLNEVFPIIRKSFPQAVFDVVGANPPQEIMDFANAYAGINVTGYVEDTTPYLEKARLMVVPLRSGGGMRVKILNTLAQGIPVVSTTIGCEGIDVEDGKHLLIANQPDEFAQKVIDLLQDPEKARALGAGGRQLIQSKYDYRVVCQALNDAYRSAE